MHPSLVTVLSKPLTWHTLTPLYSVISTRSKVPGYLGCPWSSSHILFWASQKDSTLPGGELGGFPGGIIVPGGRGRVPELKSFMSLAGPWPQPESSMIAKASKTAATVTLAFFQSITFFYLFLNI